MKRIRVNDATYLAIAKAAIRPFRSLGLKQPDASWLVPVDDEVYDRIQELKLPGETDDDTIIRMIHDYVFSRSKVAPVNPNHAADLPPFNSALFIYSPDADETPVGNGNLCLRFIWADRGEGQRNDADQKESEAALHF